MIFTNNFIVSTLNEIDNCEYCFIKLHKNNRLIQNSHFVIYEGEISRFSSIQSLSRVWLCNSMDCSMPGFPVHLQLLEWAQTHVHQISCDIHHLILSCPLLLLPSIFPSFRVFSNESVLCIRWPKYWSFTFSISPANEYSGLISFQID